jgi:hypothetical protein
MFIHPDPKVARPYQPNVRLVLRDFFDIFEVPFQYGGRGARRPTTSPSR